jgi:hypothetical protein
MPQYLLSVGHDDEYEVDFSSPAAWGRSAAAAACEGPVELRPAQGE